MAKYRFTSRDDYAVLGNRGGDDAEALARPNRGAARKRGTKTLLASALALAITLVSPARAAILLTDGSGLLTGASGVVVNAAKYDVEFVLGACGDLFGGCDSVSDFDFQNQTDAAAAAQALLDQVFINSSAGAFDSDPALTKYCSSSLCVARIPRGFPTAAGEVYSTDALNFPDGNLLDAVGDAVIFSDQPYIFARFTPSAATAAPEPSMWAIALTGFAMAGGWLRHSRRRKLDRDAVLRS